uniref:Uncharacterized protein n=1 Tax=viral metagenome TaxID=1070528 RepID=A0A6M3K2C9_9ZZZZ
MNLKKLAEAIGGQRVLLHIEGIGIREIKIYDVLNFYYYLRMAGNEAEVPEWAIIKILDGISTEPSNQFQSGELANKK